MKKRISIGIVVLILTMLLSIGIVGAENYDVWVDFEDAKEVTVEHIGMRGTNDYFEGYSDDDELNGNVHLYDANSGWKGTNIAASTNDGHLFYEGEWKITYASPEPFQYSAVGVGGNSATMNFNERGSSHQQEFGFNVNASNGGAYTEIFDQDGDYDVYAEGSSTGGINMTGIGMITHKGDDTNFNDHFGIDATFDITSW